MTATNELTQVTELERTDNWVTRDRELETSSVFDQDADDPYTLSLTQFITDFGQDLMQAVSRQNPPIYDGQTQPDWDAALDQLKRQPFDAQRARVQAVCKLLLEGEQAAVMNGEMGCGKTMMGIAAAAVLATEGYRRTLIISPPHLVYKWRREILETIEEATVWVLNGPDTLRQLLKIRASAHKRSDDRPEFFIIGRVRMRMGFDWVPVVNVRKVYVREVMQSVTDDEAMARSTLFTYGYAACPDCGTFIRDAESQQMTPQEFITSSDKRRACAHCGAQLWTLQRPGEQKNRDAMLYDALCKIPTIGPKTADKLLRGFGSDVLGSMLDDNVFDFINLMDNQGDLVFSDRQAKRMESALAKQEFSFGQGGYQASEFIKRYLPDHYFDLLVIDEGHEYKNAGSAQGQAMGVLAAKARKTIVLTGTLMGGYADDLFHLLWRVLPQRMIEDGFRYNAANSLGPAAMSFMRQHGVLKDVFKETDGGHHKTAKGKRLTVQTSKAPGFGPKGVMRYVLPYTAFLKLSQIGGAVLPAYDEFFIHLPMTETQTAAYADLSSHLNQALKDALRRGDKSLLGLVLNVLLAWPDTCFRAEEVKHPRTRELLAFLPPILAEDDISPKEAELIRLCKTNQALGRKVLVYTVYTGKRDTTARLKRLLDVEGFKTAVLRASVSTESREDWILDHVDRGIDVLICNPELVKTGLDLLDFPTICFLQSGYNVYTVQQASRRSWRIGQKQAVEVYFLGYDKTAQIACLSLMAKKIAVSQSTSGDMPDTGLDVLNSDGDSIEVALAKQLIGKETDRQLIPTPSFNPSSSLTNSEDSGKPMQHLTSQAFSRELSQFIGTEQWYRHSLNRVLLFTDGVRYFAENGGDCGAYWLLDVIATEYWPLLKNQPFMVIKITVKDSAAMIEVTDGNHHVLKNRAIDFTDLKEGLWTFYLTDNVLLLPSEY